MAKRVLGAAPTTRSGTVAPVDSNAMEGAVPVPIPLGRSVSEASRILPGAPDDDGDDGFSGVPVPSTDGFANVGRANVPGSVSEQQVPPSTAPEEDDGWTGFVQ